MNKKWSLNTESQNRKNPPSSITTVSHRREPLCDSSDCTNPRLKGSVLCVQHKFIGE